MLLLNIRYISLLTGRCYEPSDYASDKHSCSKENNFYHHAPLFIDQLRADKGEDGGVGNDEVLLGLKLDLYRRFLQKDRIIAF